MPFLFVDYDQGIGGEFFCEQLSQSKQCVKLTSKKYESGRTKVFDRFDQEFLKPTPHITPIKANGVLFELVPTHRHTKLAYDQLSDVRSIRITSPKINTPLWLYFKHQQISKVLLTREPTDQQMVGLLRILVESSSNTEFLKKIKPGMDTLSLILLSDGLEPTEENKVNYINNLLITIKPEPEFNYDLIIEYSDLFYNTESIKTKLREIFGITAEGDWLDTFKNNYETYLSKA
jgi:hypothetical protein